MRQVKTNPTRNQAPANQGGVKPEAMGPRTQPAVQAQSAGERIVEGKLIEVIAYNPEGWRIRLVIEGRPVSVAYAISKEGVLNKNLQEADYDSVRDLKDCVIEEVNVYER
jgi:hypothetical protein